MKKTPASNRRSLKSKLSVPATSVFTQRVVFCGEYLDIEGDTRGEVIAFALFFALIEDKGLEFYERVRDTYGFRDIVTTELNNYIVTKLWGSSDENAE